MLKLLTNNRHNEIENRTVMPQATSRVYEIDWKDVRNGDKSLPEKATLQRLRTDMLLVHVHTPEDFIAAMALLKKLRGYAGTRDKSRFDKPIMIVYDDALNLPCITQDPKTKDICGIEDAYMTLLTKKWVDSVQPASIYAASVADKSQPSLIDKVIATNSLDAWRDNEPLPKPRTHGYRIIR